MRWVIDRSWIKSDYTQELIGHEYSWDCISCPMALATCTLLASLLGFLADCQLPAAGCCRESWSKAFGLLPKTNLLVFRWGSKLRYTYLFGSSSVMSTFGPSYESTQFLWLMFFRDGLCSHSRFELVAFSPCMDTNELKVGVEPVSGNPLFKDPCLSTHFCLCLSHTMELELKMDPKWIWPMWYLANWIVSFGKKTLSSLLTMIFSMCRDIKLALILSLIVFPLGCDFLSLYRDIKPSLVLLHLLTILPSSMIFSLVSFF